MKDPRDQDEIYSNPVRAGKRTYFFDVRATKSNDYYLTITESKRTFDDNGVPQYKKHKIFLYKEDFEKFSDGLTDVLNKIAELNDGNNLEADAQTHPSSDSQDQPIDNIEFEDLD